MPIPPSCARAMARAASVTVSMAELTSGMLRRRLLVSSVATSVSRGNTSERAGRSKTSSNVKPSGSGPSSICVPLWVEGEGCRMHTDIFTLTAQKLLFNISQSNMQEHGPAVWTGKRHGDAGQVVQQRPDLVVMQVLMGTHSAVTRHHSQ